VSAIPPDIAGSAAQAGFASSEASRVKDADRAGQATTADRQVKAATDAADSVETSDSETAVYADAEGAGGQGRPFLEAPEEEQPEAGDADEGQSDSPGHLDIQA